MSSRITTTARPGRKRWLFLTAIPLLAAAPAWACTTVSNIQTYVTPTTGTAGSSISASAGGAGTLAAGLSMTLLFADANNLRGTRTCHHNGVFAGGPTTSTTNNVASTPGKVPSGAVTGAAQVCFAQSTNHSVNTTPASFTVS